MRMVFVEDLKSGMVLAEDVFESADSVSPISRSGITLTDYVIARMKHRGIRSAYIRDITGEQADDYVVRGKKSKPLDKALRNDALSSLENIFTAASISKRDVHTSSVQLVGHIDSVVGKLVSTLSSEKDALVNISDLKSFDDYTYHHSLSVAVLALAMGSYLKYSSKQLNRLGICAMMHDIGKTAIPIEVIHKPSRLDDAEFDLIKTHSAAGYEYLLTSMIGDDEIRCGVLYHHEKVDGTGYPSGLKGQDIPEWSRIISVADVYDALTSNRPYREPMSPAEAIEYIMGGSGSSFDFNIVSALVRKIDLYPIGCKVEFSDHRIAEVLDNEMPMRPVVRILETSEILDMYRDRQCLSLVVNRLVSLPPSL